PAGDAAPARLRGGPGPRRHPGRAARHHRHHRVRLGREPAPDPRRRGRAARGRARPGDPVPDRRGRARPPPRCRDRARTGQPAGPATGLSEVAHMSAEAPAERRRREDREPAGSLLQPLLQWATLAKLVNALVPVLLIGMAAAPLEAVYLDAGLWVTVVVALLLGGLLAVIGAAYRLGILTMISVTVVVFFVCVARVPAHTHHLAAHGRGHGAGVETRPDRQPATGYRGSGPAAALRADVPGRGDRGDRVPARTQAVLPQPGGPGPGADRRHP